MELHDRRVGHVVIVELEGRLTVNDQPGQLKDAVARAVRQGVRHVLLDLSRVNYLDSTKLGELIAAHVTISREGGALKLVGTPPRVASLIAIAGLGEVFERFETTEAAMKSLETSA